MIRYLFFDDSDNQVLSDIILVHSHLDYISASGFRVARVCGLSHPGYYFVGPMYYKYNSDYYYPCAFFSCCWHIIFHGQWFSFR